MCGIFGIWHLDGKPASEEELTRMGQCMIHRGPDDEGYLRDGPMGIGMRRLSIIDLVGGHQPISNEDGSIHVVFNGEIFNYPELRDRLRARGHTLSTNSDTEVLVHLYEDMGRASVHELIGMFAFAIWDARKRSLWVVRDRLGIKPLYWHRSAKSVAFASDLGALNSVVGAPVSDRAVARFLGYSYVPGDASMFEGIHKLLPGEELVVEAGEVSLSRYWSLPRHQAKTTLATATAELDALLDDAVRRQLQSDVPVGVFLSGGLDSSAVAAYSAAHMNPKELRTFTVDFVDKGGADAQHARQLSQFLGSDHTEVSLTFADQIALLDRLMFKLDEPMADNAIVPTFALAERAAQLGVKVLLSGAGGDEIFGGYDRYYPGRPGSGAWFAGLPAFMRQALKPAWQLWNPAMQHRLHNPSRNFFASTSGIDLWLLQLTLRDRQLFDGLLADFDSHSPALVGDDTYPRMRLDLERYLPDNILALTDKATMAASVEGRVPLLDHRIVEFCFSLPESINLQDGTKKGLFRSTMKSKLPDTILHRSKEGFNAPTGAWINQWVDLIRTELRDRPAAMISEMLDLDHVLRWFDEPKLRARGAELMYSLYVLNRWLTIHGQ